MIVTINPATEEPLREYPAMNVSEIEELLALADADQAQWRSVGHAERRRCMQRLAALLRDEAQEHAALISREMGKPLSQAVAEVQKSAWVCEYYAEHAEAFLQAEECDIDGLRGMVRFDPIGLVLGVMPWNFPFWQVFRFAVPVVMAGNGAIVKHAPNVTGSAIVIEELFRRAGFPENLYRAVHLDLDDVGPLSGFMIEHDAIKAVSITGSTAAGRAVATKAGHALKRSVLELGGSDPYIVLEDADLDAAVTHCAAARLLNSGQSCIAAKRFIVHSAVMPAFEERLLDRMRSAVMGDPFDPAVELGPMARKDLRDELHSQVVRSVEAGARLLLGGEVPAMKGYYYPPTVLAGVRKGMVAYSEETFGPVATLIEVADDDEAVAVANDTPFGLGSAVFSADQERALALASRLDAGSCFINGMVKSDPRLPFGGVKQSGYGRELARYGIREFVNIKSMLIG